MKAPVNTSVSPLLNCTSCSWSMVDLWTLKCLIPAPPKSQPYQPPRPIAATCPVHQVHWSAEMSSLQKPSEIRRTLVRVSPLLPLPHCFSTPQPGHPCHSCPAPPHPPGCSRRTRSSRTEPPTAANPQQAPDVKRTCL